MAAKLTRKLLLSPLSSPYYSHITPRTILPTYKSIRNNSDGIMPTTLSRVDVGNKAPLISSYSVQGFSLQGVRVVGSVALLPKGFFHWKVSKPEDITPESLVLFALAEPKLEIVVIGTGTKLVPMDTTVKRYLQEKGISVEVQDTPNACATFNFLLDDRRLVGGALIPPDTIN